MQYNKVPKKEILAFYYIQPALHSLSEKSRNIATPKVTIFDKSLKTYECFLKKA